MKIHILPDTETVFIAIIINASNTDKRLLINVNTAKEAYNDGIAYNSSWKGITFILSDAMTKLVIMHKLAEALTRTNCIMKQNNRSIV